MTGRENDGRIACACDPEKDITCMFHFDLDAYIIRQALNTENKEDTNEQ